jgi:hypothetical protein
VCARVPGWCRPSLSPVGCQTCEGAVSGDVPGHGPVTQDKPWTYGPLTDTLIEQLFVPQLPSVLSRVRWARGSQLVYGPRLGPRSAA